MENLKCEECGRTFSRTFCLNRHYENIHIKKKKKGNVTSYTCDKCNKFVPSRDAFRKHWRRFHVTKPKIKLDQRCPICKLNVDRVQLQSHFFHQHKIELKETEHSFPDEKEFEMWKKQIEICTDSKFKVQVTRKERNIRKYVCHRSGIFTSISKNIRQPKAGGSKKINGVCPASIHFTKNEDGHVRVKFIETHVGHDCDNELRYSNISPSQKVKTAKKGVKNVSKRSILQKNRQSCDGVIEKEHFVSVEDIEDNILQCEENFIIEEIQNHENIYTKEEITSRFNNILKKTEESESARRCLSNWLADVEMEIDLLLQRSPCIANNLADRRNPCYVLKMSYSN